MKSKPYPHFPGTTGWASMKLSLAFTRLLWEIVRELKINRLYGVPDRKK